MNTTHYRVRAIAMALSCLCAVAQAQAIYKCGSNYTDRPCPQAVSVPTADPRTPAQKAQTVQATVQAAALAEKLERTRRADEAAADRRAQIQAKAANEAAKLAQKAKADAARAEAKSKKNEAKTKVVKLTPKNAAASKQLSQAPTPEVKASAKVKPTP